MRVRPQSYILRPGIVLPVLGLLACIAGWQLGARDDGASLARYEAEASHLVALARALEAASSEYMEFHGRPASEWSDAAGPSQRELSEQEDARGRSFLSRGLRENDNPFGGFVRLSPTDRIGLTLEHLQTVALDRVPEHVARRVDAMIESDRTMAHWHRSGRVRWSASETGGTLMIAVGPIVSGPAVARAGAR